MPNLPHTTLTINFVRSGMLQAHPRMTYSRGSTAVFANQSGVLKSVSNNVPRRTASPGGGNVLGLWTEAAATNVALRSEEFDISATWLRFLATSTANAVAAPDGNTTADRLTEDNTASQAHYTQQTTTAIAPSVLQTFSVWVKKDQRNVLLLVADNGAQSNNAQAVFDLTAGTASATAANGNAVLARTLIEAWPNGWYRCAIACTPNTSGTTSMFRAALTNGTTVASGIYNGDNASGAWMWGAQLETGGYPTSYIATTTASVARSADSVIHLSGSFVSPYEGTMLWEGEFAAFTADARIYSFTDNSANNIIRLTLGSGAGTSLLGEVISGGVSQASLTLGTGLVLGTRYSALLAWKANDIRGALNGVISPADTSATIPTGFNRFGIGDPAGGGGATANAYHGRIIYWAKRMDDTILRKFGVP